MNIRDPTSKHTCSPAMPHDPHGGMVWLITIPMPNATIAITGIIGNKQAPSAHRLPARQLDSFAAAEKVDQKAITNRSSAAFAVTAEGPAYFPFKNLTKSKSLPKLAHSPKSENSP